MRLGVYNAKLFVCWYMFSAVLEDHKTLCLAMLPLS